MKPSIIICTRNRAKRLLAVFDRFAQVTGARDAEFLVVDSHSTDDTHGVLGRIAEASPLRITVLTADRPGLGYAQNVALAVATGDPLIFTDDDCYPLPDFLLEWLKVFEDPRIGFAGGRIELYNKTHAPVAIRTSMAAEIYPPGSFVVPGSIQGANLAFRRETLISIGGFDARFGSGGLFRGANDIEAAARASAAGWFGGYFPGPAVSHDHGRTAADLRALFAQHDHCRGAYYAKFMLNDRTRGNYMRKVYWRSRGDIWKNPRRLWREGVGALHFVVEDRVLGPLRSLLRLGRT